MIWKRKKKDVNERFEDKIKAAKYERILQSLKDILKLEITVPSTGGQNEVDYMATCSAMKTKARLAIDFIADLEKNNDD